MRLGARQKFVIAGLVGLAVTFLLSLTDNGAEGRGYGYRPNPEGTRSFLRELPRPFFNDIGADVIANAQGDNTLLYRFAYQAHLERYGEPWVVGKQGIGDCVSWGWAHCVWMAQCVDWGEGAMAEAPLLPATESIYGGSRVEADGQDGSGRSPVGGYSDGSYGAAAAKWCRDWGIVYREPQESGEDLTTYSAERAKSWGAYGNGGQGDDGKLDDIAKLHPCKYVALVKTFDEAAAAIESGYPVAVCSMVGFSSTRDSDGFCNRQGSWAHCMAFIAVRYGTGDDGTGEQDSSGRRGLLCLNSWGPTYVGGPKWPSDQPDGSFWIDEQTVNAMLREGDSFAVGGVAGFTWRDLDHREWLQVR